MLSKPEIKELPYCTDSRLYFQCLSQLKHPVWLDSGKPASTLGRYDILSAEPVKVLRDASISEIEATVTELAADTDFSENRKWQLPFLGGAIGFFNYEYNHSAFGLKTHDSGQCAFGIFDWCLIQDHERKQAFALFLPCCGEQKKSFLLRVLENNAILHETGQSFSASTAIADTDKQSYLNAIEKVHRYILDGDTYQINYTQRFHGDFHGSPIGAYLKLRSASPSPYAAYLDLVEAEKILCLSPEQFITIDNGRAVTRPIKGTAPRSADPATDEALARALLDSEKNRAENLMIVDLLRNDFSKCCELNSVRAPALYELESYANVHHLVSTVEGKPRPGVTPLEFMLNCFPGGSITGAPKRRSMEIIDWLEQYPRRIYCGSICYLSAHGRFDSNIAIRTVLVEGERFYCWGGGGIVADSIGEEEYAESIQKIQLLLDTLRNPN